MTTEIDRAGRVKAQVLYARWRFVKFLNCLLDTKVLSFSDYSMTKRKTTVSRTKNTPSPALLKGWKQIAEFLGHPVSIVQGWTESGLPVARQGRYVTATPEQLNHWLARESGGESVHVATEESDLAAELRRGLARARKGPK
jgi:hypothetical protein